MGPHINDGYDRHVGIGDGIRVPEVEFIYRPQRGPDLQVHLMSLAGAEDPGAYMVEALAKRLVAVDYEGCREVETEKIKDMLAKMDTFAFQDVYHVVFSNVAPARIYDRDEEPQAGSDQDEADQGN